MIAIRESFLHEIWGRAAPTYATSENFLLEILISYGSAKVYRLTVSHHLGD